LGGYFYVNYLVKQKVETFLSEQLSPQIHLKYGDLYMSTLTGTISIEGIDMRLENQQDTVVHTRVTVDKLMLSGFGYWDFFVNDQIEFDQIDIDKNNLVYFKDRFKSSSKTDSLKKDPLASINKSVLIKALDIGDTSLTIYDESKDSVLLNVSKASLSLRNIKTDGSLILQKIPLTYDHVNLVSDSVYLKISPYENLTVKSLNLEDHNIHIEGLTILPKLDKKEYSRTISKERDYTVLEVPSLDIIDYDFGFESSTLFTTVKKIHIEQPDVSIYRDKLVADDLTFKPLYSKMLRDLKMRVMIDSIIVSKAHIIYEEKVKTDQPAGSIEFKNMDVDFAQVGNTQPKGALTTITADGLFQQSRLHVDWSFDVHNTNDAFRFSGSIGRLPASNINSFVKPNLNVGFEGTLEEIYFDISGNNDNSTTAMKMKYKDFKVELMRKNGLGINKLLTGIANIFVAKDSKKEESEYREGKGEATRNKNQSVFNFVWISILSALLKTMT
jgi:hypothetical protein